MFLFVCCTRMSRAWAAAEQNWTSEFWLEFDLLQGLMGRTPRPPPHPHAPTSLTMSSSVVQNCGSQPVAPNPSALICKLREKVGGEQLPGGRSCDSDRPIHARRPHSSAGVEVEVIWPPADLKSQNMLELLVTELNSNTRTSWSRVKERTSPSLPHARALFWKTQSGVFV